MSPQVNGWTDKALQDAAAAGHSIAMSELGRRAEEERERAAAVSWYSKQAAATLGTVQDDLERLALTGDNHALAALRQLAVTGLPAPVTSLGMSAAAEVRGAVHALEQLASAGGGVRSSV